MTAGVIILKEKVRVMNRTETKICPRCGNQVADGAKFCVRCGALMPQWNQQGQRAPQNQQFPQGQWIPQDQRAPQNQQSPKKKGVPLAVKILVPVLLLLLLICGGAFLLYNHQPKVRIKKYMDLGQKYLSEMNYDEALLAFGKVIELDPKQIDAYEGMADAYEGRQDYEKAAETLERGIEAAGADEVSRSQAKKLTLWYGKMAGEAAANGDDAAALRYYSRILELDSGNAEAAAWVEQYQRKETFSEKSGTLSQEMGEMLNREDYEAIYSLIESDRFAEVIEMMDQFGISDRMIFDTANGKVGIYKVNSRYGPYMLYYGSYSGEVREGSGVWIGSSGGSYYCAVGQWGSDKPNGHQAIREWNPDLNERVIKREISGNTVNGLWNGSVDWGFIESEGKSGYITEFTNGKWNVLRLDSHGDSWIVSDSHYGLGNSDHMVIDVGEENEIRGIAGFSEKD